jgi:hypothetical protein
MTDVKNEVAWPRIGRRSRKKGASFQNTVAKMLTQAWGVPILSTPQSGGLSLRGDLCVGGDPPKHVLVYSIECKNRKDLSLASILRNPDVLPVSDRQIVFFKEHGSSHVWLAWDVHRGPTILPVGVENPPPLLRVCRSDGGIVGVVRVTEKYLRMFRKQLVVQIPRQNVASGKAPTKKRGRSGDGF